MVQLTKIDLFNPPQNLFQEGWNVVVLAAIYKEVIPVPRFHDLFRDYDVLKGIEAAEFRRDLPDNWLT